jgi:hypothetical protein
MHDEFATPWFDRALERLELRRGNRVLALEPRLADVAALRGSIGDEGELTVTMQDRQLAEQLAGRDLAGLRVLACEASGGETFGAFDSVLVVARAAPLPPDRYGALLRSNLRPGGRFVVDLPGADAVPDVRAAWLELGWDEEPLTAVNGPSDVELVEALRGAGLRGVASAVGAHIVRASSPGELAARFADDLQLDEDRCQELGEAIVRVRQSTGPLEALMHRSQATGQR